MEGIELVVGTGLSDRARHRGYPDRMAVYVCGRGAGNYRTHGRAGIRKVSGAAAGVSPVRDWFFHGREDRIR